jgi:hypothetical protein
MGEDAVVPLAGLPRVVNGVYFVRVRKNIS